MEEFKQFLNSIREEYKDNLNISYDSSCVEDTITVWFMGDNDEITTVFYNVRNCIQAYKEHVFEIIEMCI